MHSPVFFTSSVREKRPFDMLILRFATVIDAIPVIKVENNRLGDETSKSSHRAEGGYGKSPMYGGRKETQFCRGRLAAD